MGMSAADAQIAYDAAFAAWQSAVQVSSYAINGRSKTNQSVKDLWEQVQKAAMILGRISGASPMVVRGVVRNFGFNK